jgi:ectoine hydroxylase-related dioxygenase (phytanoyl-CoA dioxygenase family)
MNVRETIGENGFAILPGLFSNEYTDQLRDEVNRSTHHRSLAGVRHALGLPPVAAAAQEPRLLGLAREVLGANAFPFRATLFDKSPSANWLVVWHQDTALPLRERNEQPGWGPWSVKEGIVYAHAPATVLGHVLALRLSIDDSKQENGPLRVLPRTHTIGLLSDDEIHDLAAGVSPVDCVVGKGGIVAMRPLLIHASSKSQTDTPRRVLHIEYAASASIAKPLEFAIA